MGKRKEVVEVEWSVADAIDSGVSDLSGLRDELQEWYDNLPENFQSGDKGSQLEEAIGELDDADGFDATGIVDAQGADGEQCEPASLRFKFKPLMKRRLSRTDRCNEATSLLRGALDEVRSWIDREESAIKEAADAADEADDTEAQEAENDARQERVDSARETADELENLIERAEGVSFPGMYG